MREQNEVDKYEERRKEALEKSKQRNIEHEKSFNKSADSDIIHKRMGSDLFKGGMN